jgi:hypothetical protein
MLGNFKIFAPAVAMIATFNLALAENFDNSEITTASGQATFVLGSNFLEMKEKSFNLVSKVDGKVIPAGYPGVQFEGTPYNYGSTQGSAFDRLGDFKSCGGGGSTTNPSDCVTIPSLAPHLTVIGKRIKNGLDFFTYNVLPSDQNLELPACGAGLNMGPVGNRLRTENEVLARMRLLSVPLSTVALSYPLSEADQNLANFNSDPAENYLRNGNLGLRVFSSDSKGKIYAYEFVRVTGGIEVYFAVIGVNKDRSYANLIGVLPSQINLLDIQVGSAFDKDPFDQNADLYSNNDYIRVKLNGKIYILNTYIGKDRDQFNVDGSLVNIRFAPVKRGNNSHPRDGQRATQEDLIKALSHKCFLQAKVR